MNISQLNREKCTGCYACVSACARGAIKMKIDEFGFWYPEIDKDACVNCGLCASACQIDKKKPENRFNGYAAYATAAEERDAGSSGGVFGLLAKKVLGDGGVVFGAMFDANKKKVRHASTEQVSLDRILRSKYVQSEIGTSYIEAADCLSSGKTVLFSGTPCQITGLKQYLKVKRVEGSLITVDFMCHGVPSPGFFEKYLCDMEKKVGSEIVDITFREKDLGWRTQVQKLYFANGEIRKFISGKHYYYYYYFLNNYSLRDSCFTCKEYHTHSADITLADYWATKEDIENLGTSLVFLNTVLGEKYFAAVSDQMQAKRIGDAFLGYELYSHKSYDSAVKNSWRSYYKKHGFDKTATSYYKRVCLARNIKGLPRTLHSKVKRLLRGVKRRVLRR